MPNIALDLIGQARALYTYAGLVEGRGRDEDHLAYVRLERDYKNLLLVERPNGDFGHTILRQFYFSTFMSLFWGKACGSSDETLAGIAAKAVKESRYHVRHTAEWVIRLGDGTTQSHEKMVAAVEALAPYIGEIFETDVVSIEAADAGIAPLGADLRPQWTTEITGVFQEATLAPVLDAYAQTGGRNGVHTEDMGFLLAQLQYVQRTHPNMTW
jgi:ring-1,2-phenylacetyl-CoA epoxidase subunit PaaC